MSASRLPSFDEPLPPRPVGRALLACQGLLRAAGRHAGDGPRPWRDRWHGSEGVREALRRLEAVQVDPVSAVERNHHLVLFNRVGGYRPQHLESLFPQGLVFEYLANARCVLPVESFADFWPIMLQARANAARAEEELRGVMEDLLEHVRRQGATAPRQVGQDGPRLMGVGYNPPDVSSKATGRAIDLLWLGGLLMVAARRGNEKAYDLTERVLPEEVRARLPDGDAPRDDGDGPLRPWSMPQVVDSGRAPWSRMLLARYMQAFSVADPGDFRFGWQKWPAAERRRAAEAAAERGRLVRLRVEGSRRAYYATPSFARLLEVAGDWEVAPEVRFLPPLDPLLWRRERVSDLFGFDYTWEVYLPQQKRRFGYYAMPILYGDRLVGRIDPRLHRDRGLLELKRVALERGFRPDDDFAEALAAELRRFAAFHGAEGVEVARVDGNAAQRRLLRAAARV